MSERRAGGASGSRRMALALRRRGWILLLTTLAAAAISYQVTRGRSNSYSAESVLNVPASFATASAGAADQAVGLTGTYALLIPNDAAIVGVVSRTVQRPAAAVKRRLSASQRTGTALLVLSYTGRTRAEAAAGAAAAANAATGALPVSPAIAPASLLLVRPPGAPVRRGRATFASDALLFVPSGAGAPAGAGNADQALRLATIYAGILQEDSAIDARVSAVARVPLGTVQSHVTVLNDLNTSILRVRYKDSDPVRAVAGARAFAQAVAGPEPASPNIGPRSLSIVSLPAASAKAGRPGKAALVYGAVLGLALGIVLLVAWERTDRRIDAPQDLEASARCPATDLDGLSDSAALALIQRWHSLSGTRPTCVALLPAGDSFDEATSVFARQLLAAGHGDNGHGDNGQVLLEDRRDQPVVGVSGGSSHDGVEPNENFDLMLLQAGPIGGATAGEAVALKSDMTVLVAGAGMRTADVEMLVDRLEQLGVRPVWAVLAPRKGRR